jgi:signal transduction histidine kinase
MKLYQAIRERFADIQRLGLHDGLDADLTRRVLLLNTMSVIMLINSMIYVPFLFVLSPVLAVICSSGVLSPALVLLLSRSGRFDLARQLFIFYPPLSILIFCQIGGPEVSLQSALFPTTIYSVMLFRFNQLGHILPGIVWSMLCFYWLYATGYEPLPWVERFPLDQSLIPYFYLGLNTSSFVFLIAIALYLSYFSNQAEERLRETVVALMEANQTKDRFLANMSHELRTPLNAIIGYAELIQESSADNDPEATSADAVRIDKAGRHLLAIVNDILDLSKIAANRMVLHLEEYRLSDLVEELEGQANLLSSKRDNQWSSQVLTQVDVIHTDKMRLKQILLNLISNAAKFTERGEIGLVVEDAGPGRLRFIVRDTGLGIAEDQQSRIFEAFVQADGSSTRAHQGTGLGLALTARFAELLGGGVSLKSAIGQGSSFIVELPVELKAS